MLYPSFMLTRLSGCCNSPRLLIRRQFIGRKTFHKVVMLVSDYPDHVCEAAVTFEREVGTLEQLDAMRKRVVRKVNLWCLEEHCWGASHPLPPSPLAIRMTHSDNS